MIRDLVRGNIAPEQWENMTELARIVIMNDLVTTVRMSKTRYYLRKHLVRTGYMPARYAWRPMKRGPRPKEMKAAA
jgi:hypothetical protein